MRFDGEEDAEVIGEVVDGQVIGSSAPSSPPPVQQWTPELAQTARGVVVIKMEPGQGGAPRPVDVTDEFIALATSQRSRAFALFLEVPFLAFVALHRDMPGLVRVGAAALGVMRALEVTQRQNELEQYLSEI